MLMRMLRGALAVHFTSTVPCSRLYLIALVSRLIRTCFSRVRSASTNQVSSHGKKLDPDAAGFGYRIDHEPAFLQDIDQRHRFPRQRQLAGLDHRQVEDLVDQFQQIPSCLDDLLQPFILDVGRRRRAGLHQLGEAQDRIQRAAQLMAHAGQKIRFREVGFLRRHPGAHQFGSGRLDLLSQLLCFYRGGDQACVRLLQHRHVYVGCRLRRLHSANLLLARGGCPFAQIGFAFPDLRRSLTQPAASSRVEADFSRLRTAASSSMTALSLRLISFSRIVGKLSLCDLITPGWPGSSVSEAPSLSLLFITTLHHLVVPATG